MSTGEGPKPEQSHEPNQAEIIAVGTAGAQAIDPESQTPEEARTAAEQSMRQTAQRLQITLHPDAIKQIADGTIVELERRGAFRRDEEQAQESEEEDTQSQGEQKGGQSEEVSPKKRTFAHKFLGE